MIRQNIRQPTSAYHAAHLDKSVSTSATAIHLQVRGSLTFNVSYASATSTFFAVSQQLQLRSHLSEE